jgi:hypothetical protein
MNKWRKDKQKDAVKLCDRDLRNDNILFLLIRI